MPEKKRVTIAPDAKGDGKKQQDPKKIEASREGAKSRNLNPIQRSKENIKRSFDVRKARGKYDDRIKNVVEEQERDRQYLVDQINNLKKDNEKLLRQQTHKFGITLDEMKGVKEDLEMARSTNDTLYREVEARKEECDKLQAEVDYMVERLEGLEIDKYELLQEKRIFKSEKLQLEEMENRVSKLIKDNKALRMQVLTNKLDPHADATKITSTSPAHTIKTSSPKNDNKRGSRFPVLNSRKKTASPKSDSFYYEPSEPGTPIVFNRKRLMRFRSMQDLRENQALAKQTQLQRSRSYNSQTGKQAFVRRRQNKSIWM